MRYKILIENDNKEAINHVVLEPTIETPSQLNGAREGYYWAYNHDVKYWMAVRYTIDRWGQDCYFETGVQGTYTPNFYNQWLGPLPEPKG